MNTIIPRVSVAAAVGTMAFTATNGGSGTAGYCVERLLNP
jgi:hypothetical protein